MLTKWLGFLEATVVFGGLGGVVAGLYLLATKPLPGVVLMLASMTMLVGSVGKLSEAQEARQESDAGRGRFSTSRASRYAK
jgi:hypothetical protein